MSQVKRTKAQIEAEAEAIAKAKAEAEAKATEAGLTLIAIGDEKYITKPDACKISGWSPAYINKLVNGSDDRPAQVQGIQMAGLGWLVGFHSLNIFRSVSRKKTGLQTKRWSALEVFLSDTEALEALLESDNPDSVVSAWLALDAQIIEAHKSTKA